MTYNITSLSFRRCSIKDEGAFALAEMLKTNSALVSLDLTDNEIGMLGVVSIIKALMVKNTSIQHLQVTVEHEVYAWSNEGVKQAELLVQGFFDLIQANHQNADVACNNLGTLVDPLNVSSECICFSDDYFDQIAAVTSTSGSGESVLDSDGLMAYSSVYNITGWHCEHSPVTTCNGTDRLITKKNSRRRSMFMMWSAHNLFLCQSNGPGITSPISLSWLCSTLTEYCMLTCCTIMMTSRLMFMPINKKVVARCRTISLAYVMGTTAPTVTGKCFVQICTKPF